MATPKKLVNWALDVSFSGLGSPFSDGASSESTSTSSLEYINAQLIAHGYTHGQGLSLDGLAKQDTEKVVKCLLGMLSQRIDDMTRTEELTTKIRTLSYDHERILSMYRDTTERAANAEREMNVHKSRLATVTRTLQSTESAHKHTTSELQRTRTSMQALRSAHQAEVKRLEKEKERMAERWSKIADTQVKLGSTAAGLRCANADVVDAADVQLRGKGQGFLEVALEQAETARKELFDQNRRLRGLILSTANEMQWVVHDAHLAGSAEDCSEPVPLTLSTLFPLSPTETAGDKLTALMSSIRESITRLSKSSSEPKPEAAVPSKSAGSGGQKTADSAEVDRLQAVIDKLRTELDEAQKQAAAYAAQTQTLFDRFSEDERLMQGEVGEMSELDEERKKFTEAAIRLGREKATWRSPRKSPAKRKVAGIAAGRGGAARRPASPAVKVIPPFETEVIPSSLQIPDFKSSVVLPQSSVVLPPSQLPIAAPVFVLPPPSPASSLKRPAPASFDPSIPETHDALPALLHPPVFVPTSTSDSALSVYEPEPSASIPITWAQYTPPRRPFPMAKPLAATRMIHAYSPVKPSPLSRILMLANSPDSPDIERPQLDSLEERMEDVSPTPGAPTAPPVLAPTRSLAQELGISEEDDSPPLRDKKVPRNLAKRSTSAAPSAAAPKLTAKEKGKAKAEPTVSSRTRPAVALEKENVKRAKLSSGAASGAPGSSMNKSAAPTKVAPKPFARPKVAGKLPPGKGGPRRVPIDSAEAAPVGRMWKG
ncbi:Afadin and alpha-actinin-binding-domain-containing protein [Fomitopsis serialis]|uniref:Afadin and alpha-actinin-binding-domain-containing protein n=1 Tax=Fomitopsis serialis TaxID=139415 RepID=UPI002008AB01|nr:Afadin and alpha-actinin-binding-domain-containing protein [Neoantrodia serialis]KAH9930287.1 Afadin and alpha-actinin-binding-domain-containing protein [Neoantrodia serialis]